MFDKSAIISSLYGIVGFRQPYNPSYQILDAANQVSRSDYFVNDNPYAKVELIHQNQDYAGISDSDFNDLLKKLQESAIADVCNQAFLSEDFRERHKVYEYPLNKVDQEILPDGFVGFKIELTRENNVAIQIPTITTDFATTGNVEILLYSSEVKSGPIATTGVVAITTDRQVINTDWVINNTGGDYKGEYYIGYFKDGTTPIPYKRNYDNANIVSCWQDLFIQPTQSNGVSGPALFDLRDQKGLAEYCGINPDIVVYDDYTDWIISNQRLIAHAIYLSLTIRCMSIYAASLRSNKDERASDRILLLVMEMIEGRQGEVGPNTRGMRDELGNQITLLKQYISEFKKSTLGGGIEVLTQS